MTTPLQKAAQAVLDRWNSPSPTPTETLIAELRKALDAELQQSVEPVLYQRRMRPDWDGGRWTAWDDCSEATFKQILIVPSLHGWTQEARALYLHPPQQQLRECWYESDELKVCRKCGQLHDKAITPPQQAIEDEPCEIEVTHVRWEGDKLLATPKCAPQQAKQVPMTLTEINDAWYKTGPEVDLRIFIDAIQLAEKHHGIGGQP